MVKACRHEFEPPQHSYKSREERLLPVILAFQERWPKRANSIARLARIGKLWVQQKTTCLNTSIKRNAIKKDARYQLCTSTHISTHVHSQANMLAAELGLGAIREPVDRV